jgi:hypothetical protein
MWHFIEDDWVWILIFGGGFFEWVGERFDVGVGALAKRRQRKLAERAEDRALELQAKQAEIEARSPAKPICQCGHGLSFHDRETSKCAERQDSKSRLGSCLCRRYIGPEPLAQFYAPELTDLEMES